MKKLKYIIVGCGRSGTNFVSTYINKHGCYCGHEAIFDVYGIVDGADYEYESSWYSAPFLHQLSADTRVLHVVRNPESVIRSFHKIGMCASTPFHHITRGRYKKIISRMLTHPRKSFERIKYVKAHRRLLKAHINCFEHETEFKRLEAYWREWNQYIEQQVAQCGFQYYRVRIEDFGDKQADVRLFLDLPEKEVEIQKTNLKLKYKKRSLKLEAWDESTSLLMREYGYSPNSS